MGLIKLILIAFVIAVVLYTVLLTSVYQITINIVEIRDSYKSIACQWTQLKEVKANKWT